MATQDDPGVGRGRIRGWIRRWLARGKRPMLFLMVRKKDVSGVSGTGVVAEVARFSDGTTAVHWPKTEKHDKSTTVFESLEAAKDVHGHDNLTEFVPVAVAQPPT